MDAHKSVHTLWYSWDMGFASVSPERSKSRNECHRCWTERKLGESRCVRVCCGWHLRVGEI